MQIQLRQPVYLSATQVWGWYVQIFNVPNGESIDYIHPVFRQTDQQKIEARLFFDTVLGSFRKELESSLREQSEAFDRQGKLKGLNGDWAVKTAAANTTDASGELREALIKIASEHREPFNHHSRKSMEDIKCDGTLDDLREILKNYMEQTAQRRDDVKSYIGSQSSNRAAGKVKYDVDEERKLVQV